MSGAGPAGSIGLRKRERNNCGKTSLDPITVAGTVDMQKLGIHLQSMYPEVAELVKGAASFWEDRDQNDQKELEVSDRFRASMEALRRAKVIACSQEEKEGRMFITYFEVPKKGTTTTRAIANCKAMNSLFRRRIGFQLARLEDVARAVSMFMDKNFIVLDLRHWFHQLTLPPSVTKLFSIRMGQRTWPMGFKFTPVVAQTTVACALRVAMMRIGISYKFPTESSAAPVMVWSDGNQRILLVAIVWYDNIFINTPNRLLCQMVKKEMVKIFQAWGIRVKDEMTLTTEEVEYLGVVYKPNGETLEWRHVEGNRAEWIKLRRTPPTTARDWLARLGVVNWHLQLRMIKWSTVKPMFVKAFQAIGPLYGDLDLALEMPMEVAEEVHAWLDEACAEMRWTKSIRAVPDRTIFVASDASNWGAGAVTWMEGRAVVILQRKWTAKEEAWDIHEKEVAATIEAITIVMAFEICKGSPTRLVLGTDSVTGRCRLEERAIIESRLEEEIMLFKRKVEEEGHRLDTVWIKSCENAADEPSRNKPLVKERVDICSERMKEKASLWYI